MIIKKINIIYLLFLFVVLVLPINDASSQVCSSASECTSVGTCVLSSQTSQTCSSGWTNCVDSPIGNGFCRQQCSCAGNCTTYGNYLTSSACGVSGSCSYSTGGSTCVFDTDSICSRGTTYPCGSGDSDGDGFPDGGCPNLIFSAAPLGSTYKTVYQGDSTSVSFEGWSNDSNQNPSADAGYSICPTGATCSGGWNNESLYYTEDTSGFFIISTSASTPVGVYTFPVKISDAYTSNTICGIDISYTIDVKPSRKSVCDAAWHDIPPSPIPYGSNTNPLGTYVSGSPSFNRVTFTGPWSGGSGTLGTTCDYYSGTGNTCTWALPQPMPNDSSVFGWWTNYSPAGTTSSVTDGAGRVYEFRRINVDANSSNDVMQYKCTSPSRDLTETNLTTSGSLVAGATLSFSAQINNVGTSALGGTSQTRLRIDQGNNGTYDVLPANQTTGNLNAGANEIETWSNAWTNIPTGTHRMEVCADITQLITETNEVNCANATFTVSAVAQSDLTPAAVTPTTAVVGTPQAFTSNISNIGSGSTGAGFNNLFQVANNSSGTGATTISVTSLATAILSGANANVTSSTYNFPSAATYYVRACADNNASFVGTITESNEGNNCTAWTPIVVSSSAPLSVDLTLPLPSNERSTSRAGLTLPVTLTSCTISFFVDVNCLYSPEHCARFCEHLLAKHILYSKGFLNEICFFNKNFHEDSKCSDV